MKNVTVDRNRLLAILKQNLEKHKADYAQAVEGFKGAALTVAKNNLKFVKQAIETNKLEEISKFRAPPSAPRSYENDYERAIMMVEMSVNDHIELDADQFDQYVRDNWAWKPNFVTLSEAYGKLK